MPFTMTVSPPFTLPLTTPCTTLPFSSAVSRSVPGREPLRLVAREPGLAMAVFERFDRDGHEVAGLGLDLAAVVAEFVDGNEALGLEAGIDDDEIVGSTRTTSAVITSPIRISLRDRLSSKRAAKLSLLELEAGVIAIVTMKWKDLKKYPPMNGGARVEKASEREARDRRFGSITMAP